MVDDGDSVNHNRILLLLGGTWHNFDAFETFIRSLLEPAGYKIQSTRDLHALQNLDGQFDLVVMFTCLSQTLEDKSPATVLFLDEHAEPLTKWISAGGRLLMVHSATVSCQTSPKLRRLTGGVFVNHPPAFNFMVYPMFTAHPITAGVDAFSLHDEFYIEQIEPDSAIHMVGFDRGVAYPMLWTRSEQAGRVAHIAMGHDERVWNLKPYQQLIQQAVGWLGTRQQ